MAINIMIEKNQLRFPLLHLGVSAQRNDIKKLNRTGETSPLHFAK